MNKLNIKLRDPSLVMKLSRLGSFHQSKLSFLRSFIREFKSWNYKRDLFNLDKNGYGTAVYSFEKKGRNYSLVCFAQHIKSEERSDRVIATKWDSAFVLHDGTPSKKDINRLKKNVPKQEVGRVTYKELTLSRANKSVRAFDHVVNSLSEGKQPDKELLKKVGYLYRTTAVYGSGKFGLADRFRIKDRKEIYGPFRLEMMLVYLVRQFTFDQVNHIAKHKNSKNAVTLDLNICRNLGIGNSTGLGMAPFIVNHPALLNQWIIAKEKALKAIRSISSVSKKEKDIFQSYLSTIQENIKYWKTESDYQKKKNKQLLKDLDNFQNYYSTFSLKDYFWNSIYEWTEANTQSECCEFIISLMMEVYPDIVEPLSFEMSINEDEYFDIDTSRTIKEVCQLIEDQYTWLLDINFDLFWKEPELIIN